MRAWDFRHKVESVAGVALSIAPLASRGGGSGRTAEGGCPPMCRSRDGGDGAFGADEDGSAGGVGAEGVELDAGFFGWADAGGVLGRAEVVDKFWGGDEEADVGLVFA